MDRQEVEMRRMIAPICPTEILTRHRTKDQNVTDSLPRTADNCVTSTRDDSDMEKDNYQRLPQLLVDYRGYPRMRD